MIGGRGPRCRRRGEALRTGLAFLATTLLMAWLAVNSLLGPYAGTPRRQMLAVLSIVLATVGLGICVAVVATAAQRRRKLRRNLRPGEEIVGVFPAEILDVGDDSRLIAAGSIGITLTNQRLLLHEPEHDPDPTLTFEHEEIGEFAYRGPTPSAGLRRCVLYEMILREGTRLQIRMDAAVSIDFKRPREQYLEERTREVRALIIEAEGPTPSRNSQPLDRVLVDDRPTVGLLELDENYLRVIGEHSPPLADLYYYFHWEHMDVGPIEPAEVEGLPENWRRLRLRFHGTSSLVICGTQQTVRRVREKAVARGAATVEQPRSPIGAG